MEISNLFDPWTFNWLILPALIFSARVADVTIGTIRIISVGRGHKFIAPLLGFFEVFIWLLAIGQIMQNLTNLYYYLAYAGGFAAGNFVGIVIEERLAMGVFIVRIVTQKYATELLAALKQSGYGLASLTAVSSEQKEVSVIYVVINRTDFNDVVDMLNRYNPQAFYTIEDVRFVKAGVLPKKSFGHRVFNVMRRRKGK